MSVKAKVEAIIYATEEPVTLNQLASLLKDAVLAEMWAEEAARLALNETVSDGQPAEESFDDMDLVPDETIETDQPEPEEAPASVLAGDAPSLLDAETPSADGSAKAQKQAIEKQQLNEVKARISEIIEALIAEYAQDDRGMEIRQVAGGYRMGTKPEHHDVVVNFARSLKPPIRLSLQALETLAVIAYKQPVTVPEISEIRGVDSAGVIATLLDRKLVTTAGRKQVIGRPILYKTTKEFLLRFGLNDVAELPSLEEFQKLGDPQAELFSSPAESAAPANVEAQDESEEKSPAAPESQTEAPVEETAPKSEPQQP